MICNLWAIFAMLKTSYAAEVRTRRSRHLTIVALPIHLTTKLLFEFLICDWKLQQSPSDTKAPHSLERSQKRVASVTRRRNTTTFTRVVRCRRRTRRWFLFFAERVSMSHGHFETRIPLRYAASSRTAAEFMILPARKSRASWGPLWLSAFLAERGKSRENGDVSAVCPVEQWNCPIFSFVLASSFSGMLPSDVGPIAYLAFNYLPSKLLYHKQ